jgi:hypothetical protein
VSRACGRSWIKEDGTMAKAAKTEEIVGYVNTWLEQLPAK